MVFRLARGTLEPASSAESVASGVNWDHGLPVPAKSSTLARQGSEGERRSARRSRAAERAELGGLPRAAVQVHAT
jgi:hypothetical protein